MGMVKRKYRKVQRNAAGFPAAFLGSEPKSKRKKKKKAVLLPQRQEFCRVHGFIVAGDAEMNMTAQSRLHDCGIGSVANGVAHGNLVTGFHGNGI